MKVIMISGKAGHGKDQFATFLKNKLEEHNKTVLIIKFGDPVKWLAQNYLGWNGEKDEKGRSLLQHFATDTVRAQFPTYWADIIAKFIAAENKWDYILIPDWRFINEFETISLYNHDIITLRVNRFDLNGKPYYNSNMRIHQLTHISECELDNFNFEYIVENRSDLVALEESADLMVKELFND